MIRFFIFLIGLAVFMAVSTKALVAYEIVSAMPSFCIQTVVFVGFSTAIIFVYLYRSTGNFFVQFYLLSMAIKILAYGGYLFVIVLKDRTGAFENVVFFFIVYLLFTVLEIVFLYKQKTHS